MTHMGNSIMGDGKYKKKYKKLKNIVPKLFMNKIHFISKEFWGSASQIEKLFFSIISFSDKAREEFMDGNPFPYANVSIVADHIDRAVNLVGIDHVGLGSDFDGVGDSLPEGLKDVSMYPNLINELLTRGYTKEDLKKILSGNLLRVWKQVESYARNN